MNMTTCEESGVGTSVQLRCRRTGLSLLVAILAATSATAEFEGVLEMKTTLDGKEAPQGAGMGTSTIYISKAGIRTEMSAGMQGMNINMVMLMRHDTPDKVYRIDHQNKTYTIMNIPKASDDTDSANTNPDDKYKVEKLGQETILGYKTQHVRLVHKSATTEMWTTKELLDSDAFSRLEARRNRTRAGNDLLKALKDAGADGMPIRSITSIGEGKVTTEVVKVDKKKLPASLFEIPAGYTESAGGMMGGMSGPKAEEARKKMQDAMKNMTPEQRQMIEKAMKQRSGGRTPVSEPRVPSGEENSAGK